MEELEEQKRRQADEAALQAAIEKSLKNQQKSKKKSSKGKQNDTKSKPTEEINAKPQKTAPKKNELRENVKNVKNVASTPAAATSAAVVGNGKQQQLQQQQQQQSSPTPPSKKLQHQNFNPSHTNSPSPKSNRSQANNTTSPAYPVVYQPKQQPSPPNQEPNSEFAKQCRVLKAQQEQKQLKNKAQMQPLPVSPPLNFESQKVVQKNIVQQKTPIRTPPGNSLPSPQQHSQASSHTQQIKTGHKPTRSMQITPSKKVHNGRDLVLQHMPQQQVATKPGVKQEKQQHPQQQVKQHQKQADEFHEKNMQTYRLFKEGKSPKGSLPAKPVSPNHTASNGKQGGKDKQVSKRGLYISETKTAIASFKPFFSFPTFQML